MVFSPVLCIVQFSWLPVDLELLFGIHGHGANAIACPLLLYVLVEICHSLRPLPFVTAYAIALSVCSGVRGCACPISSRMIQIYTAYLAIMNRAASLASVANKTTCLIMCAMLSMAPLFGGMVELLDRKK